LREAVASALGGGNDSLVRESVGELREYGSCVNTVRGLGISRKTLRSVDVGQKPGRSNGGTRLD
jgi:hypothetical protein